MDIYLLEYILNHNDFDIRELNNKYRLKYHFTNNIIE